jgi:2-keto-4-pentenoate hydratase/2-oxohepta-3-ene-1,7-dioic acid hydratase in catechol pathway
MVTSCIEQVVHLSGRCTLEVGDVVATGTPAGVGALMDPRRFLKAGDVVRVEIEGLGAIEQTVVAEAAGLQ